MENFRSGPSFVPTELTLVGDLTKRDLFAVHAMQAFIGTSAGPALFELDDAEPHIARAAYRMADAMLAAGGAA